MNPTYDDLKEAEAFLDEHAVPSADECSMILTEGGLVIQGGACPECEKVDRRIQSWRREFWKCCRCKVEYAKNA